MTVKRRLLRVVAGYVCVAAALLAVGSVSGCGQKGPLYLPEDRLEDLERKRDEKEPVKTSMGTQLVPAATGMPERA